MNRQRNAPPALACWLLQSVFPVRYRIAMLGDLVEEYFERAEYGSTLSASRWFWSQTCRSIPSMMKSSLLTPDWIANAGVASGVFIMIAALKVSIERIVSNFVVLANPAYIIIEPVVFLIAVSAAGCLARRLRQGATPILSLFVLLTVIVLSSIGVCSVLVPWWYQLLFLTAGPASALLVPAWLWDARRERRIPGETV